MVFSSGESPSLFRLLLLNIASTATVCESPDAQIACLPCLGSSAGGWALACVQLCTSGTQVCFLIGQLAHKMISSGSENKQLPKAFDEVSMSWGPDWFLTVVF